ncbi:MAG: purine-binding chemotaxis protein CheW [Geminicoccaceae bacterium]|nr:purine-binding chemotaxis protein CheW [Geminicoccaceae bacterium]
MSDAAVMAQPKTGDIPPPKGGAEDQPGSLDHQFISFQVASQEYGVDIMTVREIKGWSETTMLPHSPHYMRGVLNLRGAIVPIFDLRARFGGGSTETSKTHVVIIVAVNDRTIGMLVDAVSDILSVNDDDIRAVPQTNDEVGQDYIKGLATVGERMVALLDVGRLFELGEINDTVSGVIDGH